MTITNGRNTCVYIIIILLCMRNELHPSGPPPPNDEYFMLCVLYYALDFVLHFFASEPLQKKCPPRFENNIRPVGQGL